MRPLAPSPTPPRPNLIALSPVAWCAEAVRGRCPQPRNSSRHSWATTPQLFRRKCSNLRSRYHRRRRRATSSMTILWRNTPQLRLHHTQRMSNCRWPCKPPCRPLTSVARSTAVLVTRIRSTRALTTATSEFVIYIVLTNFLLHSNHNN